MDTQTTISGCEREIKMKKLNLPVGMKDGMKEGICVGTAMKSGTAVGKPEDTTDGEKVERAEGLQVGLVEGSIEGTADGLQVGLELG